MAVWAVGDIQGCAGELEQLLEQIDPDPQRDRIWFVGDLVNRGPDSLAVLRLVRSLGESAITVLGNHDLHLLAVALGVVGPKSKDTLDRILTAPDRDDLLTWLRMRPLLHHDATVGHTLVHAGLPPQWDIATAIACARELEAVLHGDEHAAFFAEMYGDRPGIWSDELSGITRLRYIVNAFSRTRYIAADGSLDLQAKMAPGHHPDLTPWFAHPDARWRGQSRIVFGHWSTLGVVSGSDHLALDGGCVWGGELAAVRLDADGAVRLDCRGELRPD